MKKLIVLDELFASFLKSHAGLKKVSAAKNKTLTETIFDKVDLNLHYEAYWNKVVKAYNSKKKNDPLKVVAVGTHFLLLSSKTPAADFSKMLVLDADTMHKIRNAGTIIMSYNSLTADVDGDGDVDEKDMKQIKNKKKKKK